MRSTTPPQLFELPEELKDDPWLLWLRENAHEDLWMPRLPVAVIERIHKRYTGQRRTTLINVWIGIRRLLLSLSLIRGNILSLREIAEWSGVSRSRLCGDTGYIQDLLDVGVIGVTVIDDQPTLKNRYNGRVLYHIDMAALEAESLTLLRDQFSESRKGYVPRRAFDLGRGSLEEAASSEWCEQASKVGLVPSGTRKPLIAPEVPRPGDVAMLRRDPTLAPAEPIAVASGDAPVLIRARSTARLEPGMVPNETRVVSGGTIIPPIGAACSTDTTGSVPIGATAAPARVPVETKAVSPEARQVPIDAVGMDRIGMEWEGGEGEERPLTRNAINELLPTIVQQAVALLSTIQQTTSNISGGETDLRGPAVPEGEPPVRWPRELWMLYRQENCDPLELDRLALLPALFNESSGGYGAYWVSRTILMLSERPSPVTVPYVKGVLQRMCRAGQWSTAQLEAPAEDHEGSTSRHARKGSRSVTTAATSPPPPVVVTVAVPEAPAEPTALAVFRQFAGGTLLLPEQERQITERVRDLQAWKVACAYWRQMNYGFLSTDKLLHRYDTLMADCIKEQPTTGSGLGKLEREIHALRGLSDQERAEHCTTLKGLYVEDRRRFVDDLRRRYTMNTTEETCE